MIFASFLLSFRKSVINFYVALVFTYMLTSCMKNTYFNSRAIAPVFKDSTTIQAEVYAGQGVKQICANMSYKPIRQGFVTGSYNHGAGHSWEAGLGFIPLKSNDLSLTLLSTYGRGHVRYSYKNEIPTTYLVETKRIDSRYQRFSVTLYTSLSNSTKCYISLGARYNFVQYLRYGEKREYFQSTSKSSVSTFNGKDSLSFEDYKTFHTIDPFINFSYNFNECISLSLQTLFSLRSLGFKMQGQGYKESQAYHQGPTTSKEQYTYITTLPQYKRLVVNVALIFHLGSYKEKRREYD